jgi:hypothetical protein
MNIVRRVHRGGGSFCSCGDRGIIDDPTVQHSLDRAEPERTIGDADNADMSVCGRAVSIGIRARRRTSRNLRAGGQIPGIRSACPGATPEILFP